jgi:hypothetical protein
MAETCYTDTESGVLMPRGGSQCTVVETRCAILDIFRTTRGNSKDGQKQMKIYRHEYDTEEVRLRKTVSTFSLKGYLMQNA